MTTTEDTTHLAALRSVIAKLFADGAQLETVEHADGTGPCLELMELGDAYVDLTDPEAEAVRRALNGPVDQAPPDEVLRLRKQVQDLRVQLAVHHLHLTAAPGASCGECGSRDITLDPDIQSGIMALARDSLQAATIGAVLEGVPIPEDPDQ
jgi:hypothetical protein